VEFLCDVRALAALAAEDTCSLIVAYFRELLMIDDFRELSDDTGRELAVETDLHRLPDDKDLRESSKEELSVHSHCPKEAT